MKICWFCFTILAKLTNFGLLCLSLTHFGSDCLKLVQFGSS